MSTTHPQRPQSSPSAPVSEERLHQLQRLVQDLNPIQTSWLSGYLAGLVQSAAGEQTCGDETDPPLTILFGTDTGNSQKAAEIAAAEARSRGFSVRTADMRDFGKSSWKAVRALLAIVSTHGEGEPPDGAREVYDQLHGKRPPDLANVPFAVLALGDSSYEHFCQTGRDLDRRLEELGARRLHPRVDCDLEFEEPALRWIGAILDGLQRDRSSPPVTIVAPPGDAAQTHEVYNRHHPYRAEVLENVRLSGKDSRKRVHHLELSANTVGLDYQPGDVLWVLPENAPQNVAEMLLALGAGGDEPVLTQRGEISLAQALTESYEITRVSRAFLTRYAELTGSGFLKELLGPDAATRFFGYANGRYVVDVLNEFPVRGVPVSELVGALRPLAPRAYSIASSPRTNPNEVHVTVGLARYRARGSEQCGVASGWLSDRRADETTVAVYVEKNDQFRLPSDPTVPIIMVGPGTGIAPFRAFVAERREQGAPGRNWLFFGDQHLRTDFLYQREWLTLRSEGVLDRLDVAWSRDTAPKTYVQARIRENGRDIYDWMEEGAHVYVCGDGSRMAPDVHQALVDVVADAGNLSQDRAVEYLRDMSRQNRYQRDVY